MATINTDDLYNLVGKKVSLVIKKGEKEITKKGTVERLARKDGKTLALFLTNGTRIGLSKLLKIGTKKFVLKENKDHSKKKTGPKKKTGSNKKKVSIKKKKVISKKKKKVSKKKISKKKK